MIMICPSNPDLSVSDKSFLGKNPQLFTRSAFVFKTGFCIVSLSEIVLIGTIMFRFCHGNKGSDS